MSALASVTSIVPGRHYSADPHGIACRRVAEARQALGMSQRAFARALEGLVFFPVSQHVVKAWESGEHGTPPGDVLVACELLTGVTR